MVIDHDTPRKHDGETPEELLEELKSRRKDPGDAAADEDEGEVIDSFELSGADLSSEELLTRMVPKQDDELVCSQCFMVHYVSQLTYEKDGRLVYVECAG